MKTIPLFYFPPTLMVVDDENTILELLKQELGDQFKLITEKSPNEAIKTINQYKSNSVITNFVLKNNEDDIQHENTSRVQFDFSKIINVADNPERYNTLGVVISDHMMPDMTGLEFCKRLRNEPLKKILLTGKAEESNVLEAFNWNIIDRYVKKNDSNSIEELKTFIDEMAIQYFIELSANLKSISSKLTILSNPQFVDFFSKIIKDKAISEFYLIDKNGSYMLVDENGNKSVLSIATDEDLDTFSSFFGDEPIVQEYINQVKLRQNMPFFGIGVNPVTIPLSNWEKYFFTANSLKCGNNSIYWSICSC
jgi:CheY-like chemotaxis protein